MQEELHTEIYFSSLVELLQVLQGAHTDREHLLRDIVAQELINRLCPLVTVKMEETE